MDVAEEFREMICNDIQRIVDSPKLTTAEKLKLHRELDGRYQACITNWYVGFWGVNSAGTYLRYGKLEDTPRYISENLEMMKAKLETYRYQMNAVAVETPVQHINVTTNVNVTITFEQVRAKIEDMTSLTDEQTKDALDKVSEIETVVKGGGSKKSKWERIKPILAWLADKSFDVAMTILPLLLQVQG